MSVSNKTNYNKNKKYWKINKEKTCQLPDIFNIVCHNFQCDIVQKAYVKIPLNQVSLQCSCKYTSISFAVKPIDEVCVEFKLAFAMEGSHLTCEIKFGCSKVVRSLYNINTFNNAMFQWF